MDRNLQILGLAKKAGLLAIGFADASAAAKTRRAQIILSASDASQGALGRAQKSAQINRVLHLSLPYTSFQLGNVSGRGSPSTLAILDAGLATRFLSGMVEEDPERFREAQEELALRTKEEAGLNTGSYDKSKSKTKNKSKNRGKSLSIEVTTNSNTRRTVQ